jgi:hypothetical protein
VPVVAFIKSVPILQSFSVIIMAAKAVSLKESILQFLCLPLNLKDFLPLDFLYVPAFFVRFIMLFLYAWFMKYIIINYLKPLFFYLKKNNETIIIIISFLILFAVLFVITFSFYKYLNITIFNTIYADSTKGPVIHFFTKNIDVTVTGSFVNYLNDTYGKKLTFITSVKTAGFILKVLEDIDLPSTSTSTANNNWTKQRGVFENKDSKDLENSLFRVGFEVNKHYFSDEQKANGEKPEVDIKLVKLSNYNKADLPKLPQKNTGTYNFVETEEIHNKKKIFF